MGNGFTWIILIIFFGIIIALIIVASIGSRKDKMEKMMEQDKRSKETTAAESSRLIVFASLNKAINEIEAELKDFKPSVGTKSLGEINNHYSGIVKKIQQSKELGETYSIQDFKLEMKPIIDELSKTKPSAWAKEATFSTNLVKVKYNALSKNKDNTKSIKEGEDKEWS